MSSRKKKTKQINTGSDRFPDVTDIEQKYTAKLQEEMTRIMDMQKTKQMKKEQGNY